MKLRSLAWILLIGCGSKEPLAVPPGTVVTPPDPPAKKKGGMAKAAPVDAGAPVPFNPVNASFLDIGKDKKTIEHVACETRVIAMVKGKATAAGENLGAGDILLAQGKGSWDVSGEGLAVFAIMQPANCEPNQYTTITKKVMKAAKDPSWVNGAMKGWFDVEGANATVASIGRLEGTAAVPEHVHETSWEILCAAEAKGTFMLNGAAQSLAPKTCVQVPPNTKHAWTPDAGSKLVAVQFYTPPGPEQRFKAFAPSDAGAPLFIAGAKADAGTAPKPDSGAPPPKR
jgi:quercetin dioxygenase-like cupin family protein/predicted small lipoprotein YifL